MSKRMINSRFFESLDVADLTILQRFLLMGMIVQADDQGRLPGDPRWIKVKIFPYDDIPIKSINEALESISDYDDTLIQYVVNEKKIIQLRNWWKYQNLQWAAPSEYQAPEGWTDRIRQLQYQPKRWVMTLAWPGSDDKLSIDDPADNRLGDSLPNGLPNASGISNTNTIINSIENKGGVGENDEKVAGASSDYQELRETWKKYFPNKPQPRTGNKTLAGKAKTRMKSSHFRDSWREALYKASGSSLLNKSSWFTLGWFLKNDDNYEKCLNGNYVDSPGQNNMPAEPAGFDAVREMMEEINNGNT